MKQIEEDQSFSGMYKKQIRIFNCTSYRERLVFEITNNVNL
ncbi:uncharacterized protein METZ01_LOCUS324591, partial [marine metagenome]